MTTRERYMPGPANLARVQKDGENWTLVLVRQLRHPPEIVWRALTDPAQLREWAPFDADKNMGIAGATVKLNTVGTPTPMISETRITRADAPNVLEYNWGDGNLRWELQDFGGGTRLTLWHNIDRRYIAMGAAGWHICLDVLDHALNGTPLGAGYPLLSRRPSSPTSSRARRDRLRPGSLIRPWSHSRRAMPLNWSWRLSLSR